MSLFQCDSCGCLENTSCTGGYMMAMHMEPSDYRPDSHAMLAAASASYKEILGLKPDQPFGCYCSVCDPAWWVDPNNYGVGPRPDGYKCGFDMGRHEGKWHGRFDRMFLPKGLFHMNEDGNLAHLLTLEPPQKYALPAEEDLALPHFFRRMPDHGLPRSGHTEECKHYIERMAMWAKSLDEAPEHLRPKDEPTRRAVLMHFATMERRGQAEIQEGEERRQLRQRLRDGASKPAHKHTRGLSRAMAAMGSMHESRPEPAPPTKEEIEKDKARQAAKIAAAEAKRKRKAEKRAGGSNRA